MTISRSNIGSQMKGNKMKKKAKKMAGGGSMLENLSPAYSLMKGKGLPHDLITGGGVLGALSKAMDKKKGSGAPAQEAPQAGAGMAANQMQGMTPMYGGGAVKKKRDGIAIKGKTKGRVC